LKEAAKQKENGTKELRLFFKVPFSVKERLIKITLEHWQYNI
jgi:hypothetical protein